MSQFAVPASSLGHHFQSHYALHLLLEVASEDPLATMTIERMRRRCYRVRRRIDRVRSD